MTALLLGLLLLASPAVAHEGRPLSVEVREQSPGSYTVRWLTPGSVPPFNRPSVSLEGDVLRIRYPVFNPSVTTLLRFQRLSGETHTAVLGPAESEWRLPAPETRGGVAREYLGLGLAHILEGTDHLLFLACLIFVARSGRRILITVTGFTLAHSATLVLAALGLVRVPVPPVEATIALSIVFLATEIARGPRDTLTWRHPIAVSSSFGLLHGFGFAAVLREAGLPQLELPAALLFFNLGVEVGQLLFVAALLCGWLLLRGVLRLLRPRSRAPTLEHARVPVGYAVGWLSSYWLVTRVASFWS